MFHTVRRLSIVTTIVAFCLAAVAFAQAQQQTAPRSAGQADPAAQAAKDSCWGRSPCLEDHRPPVAFREDWMDAMTCSDFGKNILDDSSVFGYS